MLKSSLLCVGGTFRKGCNTGLGTLSAGALALGMAEISDMTGNWAEVFNTASIVVVGNIHKVSTFESHSDS